jgi:Domain of unknown function (DUF4839)
MGDPMTDDIKYIYKTVQAIRGLESRSIAKEQKEGWELVDQTPTALRTSLKFRRVQPETILSKAWTTFRGFPPGKQRLVAAGAAGLLLFAAVGIGVAAAQENAAESASANGVPVQSAAPAPAEEAGPAETTEPAAANYQPSPSSNPRTAAEVDQVITVENNADFAALLATTDYCGSSVAEFAAKYDGRTIEFDGSITNMQNHEGYNTRYDILLGPGTEGPATTRGPAFKYEDVNMLDLKFSGANAPSYVSEGDSFRFTAEVDEYDPVRGCLFFLDPVSTVLR